MKINEVIRTLRKEEGYTQEQVANYLGVTAPAVNKWEKGVSYPDITLLPPLARLLNTSIDQLLSFKSSLTQLEIQTFISDLNDAYQTDGFEVAFNKGQDLITTYPNSDHLIFSIAQLAYAYLAMLNAEVDVYEPQIIKLYQRLLTTQDSELLIAVQSALANIYTHRFEFEAAREIINRIPNQGMDKRYLEAKIYEKEERLDLAYEIYETMLFKNANTICQILQLMLTLQQKQNTDCHETVELIQKTATLFELSKMVYLSPLISTLDLEDGEKTLSTLESVVAGLNETNTSTLYRHVQIDVDELNRSSVFMVLQALETDPALDYLRMEPRFISLMERLKAM